MVQRSPAAARLGEQLLLPTLSEKLGVLLPPFLGMPDCYPGLDNGGIMAGLSLPGTRYLELRNDDDGKSETDHGRGKANRQEGHQINSCAHCLAHMA